jgi:hypothetical protein
MSPLDTTPDVTVGQGRLRQLAGWETDALAPAEPTSIPTLTPITTRARQLDPAVWGGKL